MGKHAHVTVTIDGYGVVKVRKPKRLTDAAVSDAIAEAVAQTMQLVDPRTQHERFHPVLGKGGWRN